MKFQDSLKLLLDDKLNWRAQTEAVDTQRSLNKFYNEEIDAILKFFQVSLVECIDSLRSSVAKNSLIFAHEFFLNAKNIKITTESLMTIVPVQLHRATGSSAFLRQEACKGIDTLVNNCVYDASFIVLLKEVDNINFQIWELAINSVGKLILNIGKGFSQLEHATLCSLLTVLSKVIFVLQGNKFFRLCLENGKIWSEQPACHLTIFRNCGEEIIILNS